MDEQSLATILDILRADAQEFSQTHPDDQNDLDLVVRAWQEEVDRYASQAADYRAAMSLARAIYQDRNILGAIDEEERRATEDRGIAIGLAEGEGQQAPEIERAQQPGRPRPAPAQPGNANHAQQRQDSVECVACVEKVPSTHITTAPCSHNYCRRCATRLFEDALRDETLFPPRCCRVAIPLRFVKHLLSQESTIKFEEKSLERDDPEKTYCAAPTCSRYLLPLPNPAVRERFCPKCNLWTCTLCKKLHYPRQQCHDDNKEVLKLGKENGWRQCSKCKNLVELGTGCNHITCRCRHEFCYICGATWKTCTCVLWDEQRLIEAGHLQEVEECDHNAWRRVRGAYRCEECEARLPRFIWECEQCHFRVCTTCRFNRM